MTGAELNNCDLEPIHIPGKIQSHGFLLVVDKNYYISHVSDNTAAYLDIHGKDLLGKSIADLSVLFGKSEGSEFIRVIIELAKTSKGLEIPNPAHISIQNEDWVLIIHRVPMGYLLDFEPETADLHDDLQQFLGRSLSQILSNRNLNEILEGASEQIRKIIGYDRVMVYTFHKDGHGEVVAESRNDDLESWLGLHYPASDIPKQARELYKLNLTRLISNVHTDASGLLSHDTAPLDLTHSSLRAVSPIHIQYLKNMKVASSFSVSIVCGNELWGLIACHNYTPRFINYRQRESAKLLGQVLSSAIELRQQEADQVFAQQQQKAMESVTRHLSRNLSVPEALFRQEMNLQDTITSGGAVLLFENELIKTGNVPDEKWLRTFFLWLNDHMDGDIFATESLATHYPAAIGYEAVACGVLACRLARNLSEYMVWFRPEITTVIHWAGANEKQVSTDEHGLPFISPRQSFDVWSELVKGTSETWQPNETSCALQLRDEVNYSISRKAVELRALNEKLMEAYAELDTFAYTISHDLKNPLTAIKGYAQILNMTEPDGSTQRKMTENIELSANRMGNMIEEILAYSRVGQFKFAPREIDMQQLLSDIKAELIADTRQQHAQVHIGHTPNVSGDPTMIAQIFGNLVSNAVKYSAQQEQPEVSVQGEVEGDHILYRITDNGIGISPKDYDHIFELFSRSSNAMSFAGSGVGLSIVKRMVEKHHGEIWVESELGSGSTFFLRLPVAQEQRG